MVSFFLKCNGCSACYAVCPNECIKMIADEDGFLYPRVEEDKCIKCGLCEKACPISKESVCACHEFEQSAYAAYTKDEYIHLNSSSGGIFTEIAKCIIADGGVVFGAAFDADFNVVHTEVETADGLEKFRGSKYVQSSINDAYSRAKNFLLQGRPVLFTGTPCQIGGLYAYLGKSYENLYTQDIICHGVPSPMVWQRYIKYRLDEMDSGDLTGVCFRSKDAGWQRFSMTMNFDNGQMYVKTLDRDYMLRAFLKNLCLRPSCHDCSFKGKKRQSDITLADFWGVQHVLPDMYNHNGTSLVFINSKKGKDLFDRIGDNIIFKQVDADTAIAFNSAMIKSATKNPKRDKFMSEIKSGDFSCVPKYCKSTFIQKVKRKTRRILSIVKNKILRR